MSAKYTKKKKTSGKRVALWVTVVLLVLVLAAALLLAWGLYMTEEPEPTAPTATEPAPTQATVPVQIQLDTQSFSPVDLGSGLQITDMGGYTGIFMEDGSDEVVTGVLMLVVKNTGDKDIQYANITLDEASFTLSTLPVGESCVLLEQNRMAYTGSEDASRAVLSNLAVFTHNLSLQEDMLRLQALDGALNVVNISGRDIEEDIVIYYKNAAADMYYGGITYRIRIQGGIKADEIKQLMASHFSEAGSRIMFVTLG